MPATDTSRTEDPVLNDCLQQASAEGLHLMADLIAHTRRALALRDDGSSADVTEALRQLDRHEVALRDGFPARLRSAFTSAREGRTPAGIASDSLGLMDDSQLKESVEAARLRSAAAKRLEASVAELDPLVCAARRLTGVRRQDNLFRPGVCLGAVREAVAQTGASSITQSLWLRPMRQALDDGLVPLYENLKKLLLTRGVTAAFINQPAPDDEWADAEVLQVVGTDLPEPAAPRRTRLMLVDDDKAVVAYLAAKLGKDYEIVSTTDPTAAVNLAAAEQPDVILCDIDMPGMSGGEVATALGSHPRTAFIPLIYLTALATPQEMADLHGMVSGRPAVAKKSKLSELIEQINRHART